MSPNRNLSRQACFNCSLLCHNDPSINIKGEHAQTQFWSNFEITKCCGYREVKVKVANL